MIISNFKMRMNVMTELQDTFMLTDFCHTGVGKGVREGET